MATGEKQRPIPGLYKTAEEAARAAVRFVLNGSKWPEKKTDRQARGEVSCARRGHLLSLIHMLSTRTPHDRDQSRGPLSARTAT